MPEQARSRATVDAILQACSHILVEGGYERVTTTRVAERAGVSIGSLYQYFPGREALVAAPVERHAAGLIAEVSTALAPGAAAEEGIRRFVRSGIGAYRIALDLHKVLTEQVPRVGRIATAIDTSRLVTEMLAGFLQARRDDLSVGCDITTAAIIILLRRNRKMVGTPLQPRPVARR